MSAMNKEPLPLGLSLTMALKPESIDAFAALKEDEQEQVIEKARKAKSPAEMRSIVNGILETRSE